MKRFGRREEAKFAYSKARELDRSGEDNFGEEIKSCENDEDYLDGLLDDKFYDLTYDDNFVEDSVNFPFEVTQKRLNLADTYEVKGFAFEQNGDYCTALVPSRKLSNLTLDMYQLGSTRVVHI